MFATALIFLAATPLIFAGPLSPEITSRSCGSDVSEERFRAYEDDFAANRVSSKFSKETPTDISVYFHVVSSDGTEANGNISQDTIDKQMEVLNAGFSASAFTWTLAGTTRTVNATWFTSPGKGSQELTDMKTKLRQGGANTLNVYSVGVIRSGKKALLGYGTFPVDYSKKPQDDGVVITFASLPGGSSKNYNQGKTLTHEVGHWVGLYHTFRGGCSGNGDEVDDTPSQKNFTSGCPTTAPDSCNTGKLDPIHNYMDYSYDVCLNEFTSGQTTRLQDQVATYRIGK